MATKGTFPPIPEALLKALDEHFPGTIPSATNNTIDDFRILQGEQNVIRFLKHQHKKQTENILEK